MNQIDADAAHFEDSPSYEVLRPRHDPATGMLVTWSDFQQLHASLSPEALMKLWAEALPCQPALLETKYRLGHNQSLNLSQELARREPNYWIEANSSAKSNATVGCFSWLLAPIGGPCLVGCCVKRFEVPVGFVRPVEDGEGSYLLAGEGVHCHMSPFMRVQNECFSYSSGVLTHGDWCLVVVDQGFIGLAMDKGQPVLLPPGFHQWKSTTLKFEKTIDLNNPVIYLGPYTLLTVDEGYAAVTQNNGKQEIKDGGAVHLLTHRNHKFEKFLTTKVQTDDLQSIEVITGDNVLMVIAATVNWRIADVEMAARNAAETMGANRQGNLGDITKLRNDVLKQASASLSSFIGTVNYSDTFSPTAQVQQATCTPAVGVPVETSRSAAGDGGLLFDIDRMKDSVAHANNVAMRYGVEIISINIISAKPADSKLMTQLAKGAVAAAEAQQLETTAKGNAKAIRIKAQADSEAAMINARAAADCKEIEAKAAANADEELARGSKNAADLISTSQVAVELAKIEKTGTAINKANSTMFFGADSTKLGSLLANPNVIGN